MRIVLEDLPTLLPIPALSVARRGTGLLLPTFLNLDSARSAQVVGCRRRKTIEHHLRALVAGI